MNKDKVREAVWIVNHANELLVRTQGAKSPFEVLAKLEVYRALETILDLAHKYLDGELLSPMSEEELERYIRGWLMRGMNFKEAEERILIGRVPFEAKELAHYLKQKLEE